MNGDGGIFGGFGIIILVLIILRNAFRGHRIEDVRKKVEANAREHLQNETSDKLLRMKYDRYGDNLDSNFYEIRSAWDILWERERVKGMSLFDSTDWKIQRTKDRAYIFVQRKTNIPYNDDFRDIVE